MLLAKGSSVDYTPTVEKLNAMGGGIIIIKWVTYIAIAALDLLFLLWVNIHPDVCSMVSRLVESFLVLGCLC